MSRLATTPPPPQPPELIGFYSGTHSDRNGRSLESVLAYSAEKLERHHDYIQTLFPLPERSAIDPHAPIIDEPVFKAFHSDPNLRANLLKAFKRILWFYGFELDKRENGNVVVKKGPNFDTNPKAWNRYFCHNHLRITRIIRCLRVLGLQEEALSFYAVLIKHSTNSNPKSREFWRRAAFRTLNQRPDDETKNDSDLSVGRIFLRKYEEELNAKKKKAVMADEGTKEGEGQSGSSIGNADGGEDPLSPGPPRKRTRK